MFSTLGISSKHLKIENSASRSASVIVGIVAMEPFNIFQGSPDGWQVPPDGADLRQFKTFLYSNPSEPLTAGAREVLLGKIDYFKPSLIVVDGVNAAMNIMGLDLEKNKDATSFSQEVLRPLRLHNAAILTIDHVTKSKR